jgi:hypothetical protein
LLDKVETYFILYVLFICYSYVLFLRYLHYILNILLLGSNYTRMASTSVEEVVGDVEAIAVRVEAGPGVAPAAVAVPAPAHTTVPTKPMRWNN